MLKNIYKNQYKWLTISLFIIICDQITKIWAIHNLEYAQSLPIISNIFNLKLAFNFGAAFSILSNKSGWQHWFLTTVSCITSIALFIYLFINKNIKLSIAIALILGGAIGNLIDRWQYGFVIDFIDIYYKKWHWPTFNIADSAITCGVILWLLLLNSKK